MLCIDKYVRLQKLFITKVCSEKSIMAFLLDASVHVRAMSLKSPNSHLNVSGVLFEKL